MKKWFNKYYLIEDSPQPTDIQDNGIVNRAENYFLGGPPDGIHIAISSHEWVKKSGQFQLSPVNPRSASQDNLRSMMSISYHDDYIFHKRVDIWNAVKKKKALRPDVFCFLLALKYWQLRPLILVTHFFNLITCLRTHYKFDHVQGKMTPATDGKRLTVIQLEGTRSIFRPLFYWILTLKHGNFRTYLTKEYFWKHDDHPNRLLAEKKDLL